MLGTQALAIGLVDKVLCPDRASFPACVRAEAAALAVDTHTLQARLTQKQQERDAAWFALLEEHQRAELRHMAANFKSPEYARARAAFVHKACPVRTPEHLAHPWPVCDAALARGLNAKGFGGTREEVAALRAQADATAC